MLILFAHLTRGVLVVAFLALTALARADQVPVWKISPGGADRMINSVAVSADGGRVVGGTYFHNYGATESRRAPAQPASSTAPSEYGKFGVYCYNAAGTELWREEFEGWQGVYWVALAANGKRAAAGGLATNNMPRQGFVRVYDGDAGTVLLSQRTQKRVNQVALSADGAWVVSAAETLRLFHQGSPNRTFAQSDEFAPGNQDGIVSAAISADGLTVAYADYAGHIGVFANEAGKLKLRAQWKMPGDGSGDFCHMLDLAPDGKCFAAGGSKGLFYFFDVAKFVTSPTPGPTCTFDTHVKGPVYGVAIAGNGSLFAGIVNNGDAGVGYLVPVVNDVVGPAKSFTTQHNPNGVVLNATHGMMAVADGHPDKQPGSNVGRFYLFDTATGVERWSCATGKMSWPIAIAANGSAVVGGSDDSSIYYFKP